jgi:putative oxidoreductase
MMHGAQKLFGVMGGSGVTGLAGFFGKLGLEPALFWAWVVTIVEFFGGAFIFAGLFTRVCAALLAIDMTVAILKVHAPVGFFWLRPGGGFEFPLTLAVIALTLVLSGPSFLSLDRLFGLEERER